MPGGQGDNQLMSWMDAKFGPDGALYLLDYGGGFFSLDGRQKLSRVTYHGAPASPQPAVSNDPVAQATPTKIDFSGVRAGGVQWAWDFGDGTTSTRMDPSHTYTEGGRHTVTLTVTYADGETSEVTREVNVACPAPDARSTVWFLDRDSGVANVDVGGGCGLNDVVDDESSWGSHQQFVSLSLLRPRVCRGGPGGGRLATGAGPRPATQPRATQGVRARGASSQSRTMSPSACSPPARTATRTAPGSSRQPRAIRIRVTSAA